MNFLQSWPRGGMVTRRIANPYIPVRFWAWPPKKSCVVLKKKYLIWVPYSSVAQLVEQLTVNQLVAGSSPARGAKFYPVFAVSKLLINNFLNLFFWSCDNSP